MYVDHTKPPFIDVALPPAIIIPAYALILLYSVVLLIDFALLSNERHFSDIVSHKQLRIGMAIVHILIPMVFVSGNPPIDLLFAATPWFLASYSARIPTEELTLEHWVLTLFRVIVKDSPEAVSDTKIRMRGASKMALGVLKYVFAYLFVNPLLPRHSEYALEYPWLSMMSMIYTVLYGVKGYCLLGVIDFFMGLEQLLFAWNMVDLFNYPIISVSPRDFWSRRWNKIVRNLLHEQVFSPKINEVKVKEIDEKKKEEEEEEEEDNSESVTAPIENTAASKSTKKVVTTATTTVTTRRVTRSSAAAEAKKVAQEKAETEVKAEVELMAAGYEATKDEGHDVMTEVHKTPKKSFWVTRPGRGWLAFIVSGVFHELMIMSTCRRITLENLAFFTLQGLFVMVEVTLRQGAWKMEPRGRTRVVCIVLHLILMSITGRLFTGPFLRYEFFPVDLSI